MKILNVVGARPNFMKIAPLMDAYKSYPNIDPLLIHTGQHYDKTMSDLFFQELDLPKPDINLQVGSATHAVQTAEIMKAFEPVVLQQKPNLVIVVGDVNSTIACGLVAVKAGAYLAHVEAGLRSFDRTMPEEINRILTDAVSDLLFCTEQSGVENLKKEGVPDDKIHLVGNVMIDSLLKHLTKAQNSPILDQLNLKAKNYAVLTLHRPTNVDDLTSLKSIFDALETIQNDMPVIFPIHPRTKKNLFSSPLGDQAKNMPGLKLLDPIGYLDFLKLLSSAAVALTDSGGIQEETTILKIPCLTLRKNTERPVTLEYGSNQIVGADTDRIISAYNKVINDQNINYQVPPLWDGQAADRIVKTLVNYC
ncbi:MAG: UDP-N-acetylglucosamine 2-epimerase (non-hydrolyzing) [Planctomycetes bacterium]|nr:UDP-N-acetylglucosamine 2-epimerase (non-hydrolyzing) [Planctomycetota bacterium]